MHSRAGNEQRDDAQALEVGATSAACNSDGSQDGGERPGGRQALMPSPPAGALVAALELDLDEEFELPSVLRPDQPAAPRRPGASLAQLSPVRGRRERSAASPGTDLGPTLAELGASGAVVVPLASAPSPTATQTRTASQSTSSQRTPSPPSLSAAALAQDAAMPAQAMDRPRAAAFVAAVVAATSEARDRSVAQAPGPAPVAPAPATVDPSPPAPSAVAMSFLDTRMRRMAEPSHLPVAETLATYPLTSTCPPATSQPCADDPFAALPTFAGAIAAVGAAQPPPLPAIIAADSAPLSLADDATDAALAGAGAAAADLLRPLLREWLSENMPRIVEKALRIEVARAVAPPPGQRDQ